MNIDLFHEKMRVDTGLSTKNYVLVLTDNSRFYLNEEEAGMVKKALLAGDKYLEIGNSFINSFHVKKLVSGMDYEETERIKHGDYKCPSCDKWISKGKICGFC